MSLAPPVAFLSATCIAVFGILEGWASGPRPEDDQEVSIDRIRGHVVPKLRLDIHEPKVIDVLEPAIPDSEKLSVGSATFVNLDNDDDDGFFDDVDTEVLHTSPSLGTPLGDNELVKLLLCLSADTPPDASARLAVPKGPEYVSLWTNDTKSAGARYMPGTALPLSDFRRNGDWLEKCLWAEGTRPHTEPRSTEFSLECALPDGHVVSNRVALTVIGIDSVRWKGRGNSRHDDDSLDGDENWPGGLSPKAARVFPGARAVDGTVEDNARDTVGVEVTLSVAPPIPVKVHLLSFDVDDPTADEHDGVDGCHVDDESQAEDNRGTTPQRAGAFVGNPSPHLPFEMPFAAGQQTREALFQTTLQPGDNFRVVANADSHFLHNLENDDAPNLPNPDKQRICEKNVAGQTRQAREIRQPENYASNVLTIWRFFHLEIDTMAPPQSAGTAEPTFRFALRDDDGNAIATMPEQAFARVLNLFKPAFIIPQRDGGGNLANNGTVPFVRNLSINRAETFLPNHIGSMSNRKPAFWAGYGLFAFQPSAEPEQIGPVSPFNPRTGDGDPNSELNRDAFNVGLPGSCFFTEVFRENGKNAILLGNAIAHEIGHQLGARDRYLQAGEQPTDVMGTGVNKPDSHFQPADLNIIRSFSGDNAQNQVRSLFF